MVREVKGDATDASPRATKLSSSSASARARRESSRVFFFRLEEEEVDFFLFVFFLDPFLSSLALLNPSSASRCLASKSGTLTIEIPTCAILRAPTSFVPSPHISVIDPFPFRAAITASFCRGAWRANTVTSGTSFCRTLCAAGWRRTVLGSMYASFCPGLVCFAFSLRTASIAILVRMSPVTDTAISFFSTMFSMVRKFDGTYAMVSFVSE